MVFFQAARSYGRLQLGEGETSIEVGGCLLCVLCDGARRLGTRPDITPPHANNMLRAASSPPSGPCFVDMKTGKRPGSDLVVERAARVLGMESPEAEKVVVDAAAGVGVADVAAATKRILDAKELAIFHVAFNRSQHMAHFVLGAERLSDGNIFCSDSAIGSVILDPEKLEGISRATPKKSENLFAWPDGPRIYQALAVRPLRALPGAVVRNFDVKEGDEGDVVREVQERLNAWLTQFGLATLGGFKLVVDGKFGPKTKQTVEAFQEVQGLDVDGAVGPATSARLLSPR